MRGATLGLAMAAATVVFAVAYADLSSPVPTRLTSRTTVRRRTFLNPASGINRSEEVVSDDPVAAEQISNAGLAVENGRIVITNYDEWFVFAPLAIEEAIADGAGGASGVVVHIMRRALPRYPWPPAPDTELARQWPEMVKTVAEKLRLDPEPEPSRTPQRLRLI